MLKKLLKYDLKAISKYFFPMSIFILIYSLIGTLFFRTDSIIHYTGLRRIIVSLVIVAFVFMLIAYNIISQAIVVVNFYKSMVTDTGYLTHTLPVKKRTLIISKTLASLVTLIICGIVMLTCLTVFLDIPNYFSTMYPDIAVIFNKIAELWGTTTIVATIITLILMLLAAELFSISMYFVSIAFGQLLNRHKVIGSIVSYFVLTLILQIISTILGFFISAYNITFNTLDELEQLSISFPQSLAFFSLLFGISAFVFLFITNWIFSKKLNLD